MENVDTANRVRSILVALALTILGLGTGIALTLGGIVVIGAAGFELTNSLVLVVSLVLTQGVAFGGIALAYLRYRDLSFDFVPTRIPSVREFIWVIVGYVAALGGIWIAGFVATTLFGRVNATNQAAEIAMESPDVLLFLIPASFLLIGPGEELLFRGIVQGTLREVFSATPAILLASAIFAAIHFLALTGAATGRLIAVVILFIPAVVFGIAYEKTDNLVVPALIHGAYNATLFTLLYVALKYFPGGMPSLLG